MQGVDPLTPGALLADRYRIGSLLGAGGMSFVHRAVDETLGREVAVKALIRTSAEPVELERIGAEIDLLATLSHRALVTLFDAGTAVLEARPVTYLVMELVDGPTLGMRAAAGPIAPIDLAHMAQDMIEALVVVHAHGVVHRDIKPANILLAPSLVPGHEFTAKLADFGIAAIIDGDRLTDTGTVLGTAAYLSPEQAAGGRVGPASDVYSLGLVLLEAITGHREYPGPLMESLSARQARDPQVPGEIGYHWKSLLTAMTARDPDSRPTAKAVLQRLAATAEELPVVPPRDQPAPAAAPAAGAAALGTAATGAGATGATATGLVATDIAGAGAVPEATAASAARPVAAAPSLADNDDDHGDTKEFAVPTGRRPRRNWVVAGSVAAALAIVAAVAVFAMQGIGLPQSGTADVPEVSQAPADLVTETSAPPTPTPTTGTTTPVVTDDEPAPAPPETAPAETAPAETAPAETAPAETAPAETAPAEPAPTQSAPPPPAPTETSPAPSGMPAPPEETSSS
ncbi:Serine/threonine protein kinase [Agrococcus baldri]|uniref:non-specific serine/threonine protein kinase n=1 Tax=Agrococcus baldri TaxID=153730 RepID=A0AA94L0H5_9MICO|nr:serine/threonine-protein kinase [Agrococcus baldri]SFS18123.1 Serine/threonine protein kinase [Agrococcus baldri]